MKSKVEQESGGRFAYEGLERVLHEKARLSIVASLAANPTGLTFGDLKDLCALTDGNLSRHLAMLQEAGIVGINKGFENNRPQTVCHLTGAGRKRFAEYVEELEKVVTDAAKSAKAAGPLRGRVGGALAT